MGRLSIHPRPAGVRGGSCACTGHTGGESACAAAAAAAVCCIRGRGEAKTNDPASPIDPPRGRLGPSPPMPHPASAYSGMGLSNSLATSGDGDRWWTCDENRTAIGETAGVSRSIGAISSAIGRLPYRRIRLARGVCPGVRRIDRAAVLARPRPCPDAPARCGRTGTRQPGDSDCGGSVRGNPWDGCGNPWDGGAGVDSWAVLAAWHAAVGLDPRGVDTVASAGRDTDMVLAGCGASRLSSSSSFSSSSS
jgi:hypothetical protein